MTRNAMLFSIILTLTLTAPGHLAHAFSRMSFSNTSAASKVSGKPLALSGTVVETMDAGGYSYIALEDKGQKSWVAVPQRNVVVGQQMSFRPGAEIPNFTSKTLNHTFERIVFSEGPVEQQPAAAKGAPKGAPASPNGGNNGNAKVEKATGPNAYTVAELYKGKNALDKKKVVVRGKVVKVATGIMGKNWVHLRDGSGSAKKKTNDLTVTTQTAPNEGDVVTAAGVLRKDRDFGAGYKYELIIEDAVLQP